MKTDLTTEIQLKDFRSITPRQRQTLRCAITISQSGGNLNLNKGLYQHFNGHEYFRFAVNSDGTQLAVVKTDANDPKAVHFKRYKNRPGYAPLGRAGLVTYLQRVVPNLDFDSFSLIRVYALNRDVHENCVIFNFSDNNDANIRKRNYRRKTITPDLFTNGGVNNG